MHSLLHAGSSLMNDRGHCIELVQSHVPGMLSKSFNLELSFFRAVT